MTAVTYEPGRLTLVPEAFLTLAALAAGTAPDELAAATDLSAPHGHLAQLRTAGAVVGDHVDADLREVVTAVTDAVCELQLDVDDRRVMGWVAPDTCVLLLPADDGRVDVVAAPTTSFPRVIADLTGLGPRVAPPRQLAVELGPTDLETLLVTAPDAVTSQARAGGLDEAAAAALAELVTEFRSRWRVAVSWGPATTDRRALEVLDAPSGLWWVDRRTEGVRVATTTPTDVYAAVTALLPDAEELTESPTADDPDV